MSLTVEQLYGNFLNSKLESILKEYASIYPEADLPSEAILDTVLLFLRGIFYTLDDSHEYRWEGDPTPKTGMEDAENTGITITAEYPINPEILERRPAVVVTLGDRRFQGGHLDQLKHYNVQEHIHTFHDLIHGILGIHILSSKSYQARRLADWIGLAVRLLNHHLTFGNRFHSVSPQISWAGISATGDLVRSSDHEYVQASLSFNYTWNWIGRVEIIEPLRLNKGYGNLIAYGYSTLDGTSTKNDIVEPVPHYLEEGLE